MEHAPAILDTLALVRPANVGCPRVIETYGPSVCCVVSACPPGTYKSAQGSSVCLPCPSNSNSSVNGSSQCPCLQGYYRPAGSGADSGCIVARKTLHAYHQGEGQLCAYLQCYICM